MRRILRIDRSIDLLPTRVTVQMPSPYLCSACKHRAAPFSTSAVRTARPGEKVAFTEKIRQKIWGTDKPPGLENPYGDASVFDQTKKRAKERETDAKKASTTPDLGDYEPADTWDGLERVGGFGHWWKDNWDPEHQFKGFLPVEVMSDSSEITAALRRAMVEVFALKQAGKPLEDFSKAEPGDDLTQEVQISQSGSGVTLQFGSETTFEDIVQSLAPVGEGSTKNDAPTESEEDVTADRSPVDPLNPESTPAIVDETSVKENPTESEADVAADRSIEDPLSKASAATYEDLIASWDPSWLQISLDDPEVKFAVLKRTLQLTGVRIPDSAIKPTRTAQALLSHLVTPPKPRRLVEALSQKEDLMTLPNVNVFAKRVTPIDKERTVGRWKIIEKELEERGLPVTGH